MRVRIRSHREVLKFLEFCESRPHMRELAEEVKRQWVFATTRIDKEPEEYLLRELAIAKTHNDKIKEIAAKFLLRL